ncbi:hypothetical protein BRC83_09505 [Halobacteriales archaeon QS_1_68_17]|nr:MAG: hypothetical protein BRC83_09505 [Halobacteriales archaeon QS_1_68_17]
MPSRRTFLRTVGVAGLAGVAGCTDSDGSNATADSAHRVPGL